MDSKRIGQECQVQVRAFTPEGRDGPNFVPIYWITWFKKEHGELSGVASIELFEPTKEIRQLRVLNSEYIKRKPIAVPGEE